VRKTTAGQETLCRDLRYAACSCWPFWGFLAGHGQRVNPNVPSSNRDLRIDEGESVGEVTCINCSIYVGGEVTGDATTIHGRIILEPNATVSGDATAVLGDIRLAGGGRISGDATAIAGAVLRDPGASVGGDVTALAGGGWVLLILLVPVFVLGGLIALIAWLLQRSHRPDPLPVRSS
jgi:hypothetical protein